jgi:hypothetical protein
MADRIYGLDRGDDIRTVVSEGSSSPTKDVEVVVDLAVGLEKSEVLRLLTIIQGHIVDGNWPPA